MAAARRPALLVATFLVGLAVVLAALSGSVSPDVAIGVAGLYSISCAVGMARSAWPGRHTGAGQLALPLSLGLVIAGGVTVGAGLADTVAPYAFAGDVRLPVEVPLVGLFFTAGPYLLGLLRLGSGGDRLGRLRAGLDGLGIGLCGFYIIWLLVFSTAGLRGAGLTAVLLASIAVAVAAATGFHARRCRAAMLWCGLGSAMSVGGLAGLTVTLDYRASPVAMVLAALAVVGGAALLRYGVGLAPAEEAVPADPRRAIGYPLLALPLAAAALSTGYHLIQARTLDGISIVLAVSGVTVVALRELLTAIDLSRYARNLEAQDARARSLVLGSNEVALFIDGRQVVRWQSPASARQFGLSDQDVVGRPAVGLVHPQDAGMLADRLTGLRATPLADADGRLEVRLRDGFGHWRETEWSVTPADPARLEGPLVAYIRDVTQRRDLERTLRRAAYTDRLTSLANEDGLRQATLPQDGTGALIVLELAGLTEVNDMHGAQLGDAVLVEAARRLRAEVSHDDVPARLDGGRFAVLTQFGAVQAHLLASRLLIALTAPYDVLGTIVGLTGTAGLADLVPADGTSIAEGLRRARVALRTANRGAIGAVEWYDQAAEVRLRRRGMLEQELRGALHRGEFELVYQPIVELAGRRPVGAEALLRWRNPKLGTVPPAELVPVAEDLGLLDDITHWVLHRVCRQLSHWARDERDLWLEVNVSSGQLTRPELVAGVTAALETHLVPASRLVIEVAEPGVVAARSEPGFADLVEQLAGLRALGVRTALDNFGTGPTSLSQLRVLPLDLLKIDRQVFGAAVVPSGTPNAIIDVMVRLGNQLGIEVVALGLESEPDEAVARAAGCRFGQGYRVGPPVPAEHLEAYLDQHARRSAF